MKITARSQTLEQIAKTILTILIVEIIACLSNTNTNLMAAGANLSTTCATFVSLWYLILYFKVKKKDFNNEIINSPISNNKNIIRVICKILSVSIPMSLCAIILSFNKNIDSITVKRLLQINIGEIEALKQYGILSGKVDTLITLPLSFNIAFATAIVPTISKSIVSGKLDDGIKKVRLSLLISILFGIPITVVFLLFSKEILELLFPNASDGSLVLQMGSLSIVFMMLEQVVNATLQGIGKVMVPTIAMSIGVIIKFIFNIILIPIPSIGIIGATIATFLCHMVSFIIGFIILNRNINLKMNFKKVFLKIFLSTIMVMGIMIVEYDFMVKYLIINDKFSMFFSITTGTVIYIFVVLKIRIFTKEELQVFPFGEKMIKKLV